MDDAQLQQKLDSLERKIDATYQSAEKTRKYFLWVLIVSGIALLLPLVGLIFAIPAFLSTYSSIGSI